MTNRDGYPAAWVHHHADRAMAPVFHRFGPAPGKPIRPRKKVTRYGPRNGTETGQLGPRQLQRDADGSQPG